MDLRHIITLVIYLISFGISLYALNGVDFAKIMRANKTMEMQALYFILALILAYLLGNVLMVLINF